MPIDIRLLDVCGLTDTLIGDGGLSSGDVQ
jgi:hypothetical protein